MIWHGLIAAYRCLSRCFVTVAVGSLLTIMMNDASAQSPPWTQREEDLRIALQQPDQAKIRSLLDAGANVNARDTLGGSALHVAVNFRGETDVIRLLLDRGAQVNALNDDGLTPLLLALRHAHYNHSDPQRLHAVVELLLSRGASAKLAGKDGVSPLRAAMDPVNIPLFRLLLKHGAALPDDGLDWALSNERVELVKLLLERATPGMLAFKDHSGGGMLHRAAEKPAMIFAMDSLTDKGADINAPDKDGITPFGRAAQYDNIPAMTWFESRKARLRMVSNAGQTPLHLAAYGARHDVMGWLIERGEDIKARDKQGRTPLEIAIDTHRFAFYNEARKLALVKLLGGVPGDMARGRFAGHPLHEAVRRYDLRSVEKLLQAGADPNAKNESGHTPLYWALSWSSTLPAAPSERAFGKELLPLLIRHGANPKILLGDGSSAGETYEQYARTLRIFDLLERTMQRHAPRK
jgi:ankyrin repeat protein